MSDWLTYSPTLGHGNGQIIITADALSSLDSRINTLVAVNDDYSLTATTEIEQIPFNPTSLTEYLTFEIISGGTIYWISNSTSFNRSISYSKDGGETWVSITTTTGGTEISVANGDTVIFKGDNSTYNDYVPGHLDYRTRFNFSDGTLLNLKGNIMSLINSVNFSNLDTLVADYTFEGFFAGCSAILNARELLLPATILSFSCYAHMFQYCHSLIGAPELPATVLSDGCYVGMFYYCDSLINAPSKLPALSISQKQYCYAEMFEGCTSITTAPELPATTLAKDSYLRMFKGCTNLRYIKCLATDISADKCTEDWVINIPSGGTFVKNPNMSGWSTGRNGIPNGWTVVDAT